jgi:hypothetical protein
MSIVFETLQLHLPSKKKTTPSGWTSFNAPCCVHNGTNADKRQRGGLINNGEGGISYHCFNCGFKASWVPGRLLSYKMRKLFQWLNTPDDVITKLALQCLQIAEVGMSDIEVKLPKFDKKELPKDSKPIGKDTPIEVIQYLQSRNLYLEDYNFHWSPELKDRIIVPFYHKKEIVGYTARKIKDGNPKYLSDQQPGYVFNLDAQDYNRVHTIVVEGPFDAIAVEGCALLGSEVKDQQAMLLNSLNTNKIVVPDRDEAGAKLVEQAIELGWSISMPEWGDNINDVNDAIKAYGKIYTLYSIVSSSEKNELKIKLRSKKWFG